ncbi:alpha/beta hydrolase [Kitasatospora nipponensis]|uniref:Alpha/beta hydrolase n=1 Tax=Kitasatospora nipponensis TaxID=258049 RepID=A0ABP4HD30_9ACTN
MNPTGTRTPATPDALTLVEGMIIGEGHTTAYLAAGPEDGPLLVLIHGWPANGRTWKHQLTAFAAMGYRVIAPDLRGYGHSTMHQQREAYAQEHLVADMVDLLDGLGREQAVWIGHDWGSATVWGLAAHHPERCAAVASICVPYRTLERGVETLLEHVNRSIYPPDTHPYAQFDYMHYYASEAERAVQVLGARPANTVKAFYRAGNPAAHGKPGLTSAISCNGGWFGGADAVPDLPLDTQVLDEELAADLTASLTSTGFAASIAYYLNDEANRAYSDTSLNGGRLDMPVLFLEAFYDQVADTSVSDLAQPTRRYCTDLTEESIEAGHWAQLERSTAVNDALARWLGTKTPRPWAERAARP